jgi:hypothetical protein
MPDAPSVRARSSLFAVALVTVAAVGSAAAARADSTTSSNWSGYAVARGARTRHLTSVSGTWVQPTATCSRGHETAAGVWVGLGGFAESSSALEQIGTDADCTRSGRAVYSTWFELVPAAPVPIALAAHPGDRMVGSVTVHARRVTLRVRDLTTGARFSVTRSVSQLDTSSAEWIVEAPSDCTATHCTPLALTDFGTASFLAATATADGRTSAASAQLWRTTELELEQGQPAATSAGGPFTAGAVLVSAIPSALEAGTGAFTVAWSSRQSRAPVPAAEGAGANGTVRRTATRA